MLLSVHVQQFDRAVEHLTAYLIAEECWQQLLEIWARVFRVGLPEDPSRSYLSKIHVQSCHS